MKNETAEQTLQMGCSEKRTKMTAAQTHISKFVSQKTSVKKEWMIHAYFSLEKHICFINSWTDSHRGISIFWNYGKKTFGGKYIFNLSLNIDR